MVPFKSMPTVRQKNIIKTHGEKMNCESLYKARKDFCCIPDQWQEMFRAIGTRIYSRHEVHLHISIEEELEKQTLILKKEQIGKSKFSV